jgi:hypothetical protein
MTALLVAVACLLWLFREGAKSYTGPLLFILLICSTAGGVGALFSVILRMGASNLDAAAGKGLHYLEGVSRIVCGSISAFLVALAVQTEIIVPVFSKIEKTHIAMILAGLIAGASERLAPSIISAVEGNKKTEVKVDNRSSGKGQKGGEDLEKKSFDHAQSR